MLGFRTQMKFLLYGSPVYRASRAAFLSLYDRKKLEELKRSRDVYKCFMRPGDLVFDVGANVGDYTHTFLDLGARVVAVEPDPDCARLLRRIRARRRVHIENVAVGDRDGMGGPSICDRENSISTLSEAFKGSQHMGWDRSIKVPITTLDALSQRFGEPNFVKIDTEGFDDKVLAGMTSFRPPALSFEFLPMLPDVASRSLTILGDAYRYNYMKGHHFAFESSSWVDAAEMHKILENVDCKEGFGDVFARRVN